MYMGLLLAFIPNEKKLFFFSPTSCGKFKYSFHGKQQLVFHITISDRKCVPDNPNYFCLCS